MKMLTISSTEFPNVPLSNSVVSRFVLTEIVLIHRLIHSDSTLIAARLTANTIKAGSGRAFATIPKRGSRVRNFEDKIDLAMVAQPASAEKDCYRSTAIEVVSDRKVRSESAR